MSVLHLHLLLNHVPLIGAVFSGLLLAVALVRRNNDLAKVSFAFLGLIGAMSVAVFMTGGAAEEAVERLPGFSEQLIERHEEVALFATVITGVIGALTLGALAIYRRRALPGWLVMYAFLAVVGSTALMGYTANLGGQIRHEEIRAGFTAGAERPAASDGRKEEH